MTPPRIHSVILDGFTEPPTEREFNQHIASGGRGVLCALRASKPIVGARVYLEPKYTYNSVLLTMTAIDTVFRWWWIDNDGRLCEGPRILTLQDKRRRVREAREELARAERELNDHEQNTRRNTK